MAEGPQGGVEGAVGDYLASKSSPGGPSLLLFLGQQPCIFFDGRHWICRLERLDLGA